MADQKLKLQNGGLGGCRTHLSEGLRSARTEEVETGKVLKGHLVHLILGQMEKHKARKS